MNPKVVDALWWQLEGDECASQLRATCDRLERMTGGLLQRYRANLSMFEGFRVTDLTPTIYFSALPSADSDHYETQRLPLARGIVNAAVAKIAGKQQPKIQYLTDGADWSEKRRAKKLERVHEAVMAQSHQGHADAWAIGELCLRDAAVMSFGAMKWYADMSERRVSCRRVPPWQLFVDPQEASEGTPLNLFHAYPVDRYKLIADYPDKKADILEAPVYDSGSPTSIGGSAEHARMAKVQEAWRLPTGDVPGRHVVACGDALLVDEEWTRKFFPFEFFVWEPWFSGMFGTSIVDIVGPIHEELNAATERWATSELLGSNVFVPYQEGTIKKEDLETNVPWVLVPYAPGAPPPVPTVPNTIGPASMAWNERLQALGYEMVGVSQMAATGNTPQGVTAAVAMRTKENIATERFSLQWRMYERVMSIGAARQIFAILRELIEDAEDDDEEVFVNWPGGKFLRQIGIGRRDLDEMQYEVRPASVSGLVNTVTDRLNLASELHERGIIGNDSFMRIIQFKDVDREITGRQSELLDKMIERWLDADVERLEDQDSEYIAGVYWPPEPFLKLDDAIVQVGRAYFDARLNECPDVILELFTRYMADCDAQVQKQLARQAALQAQARGAAQPTPGAPPAGAPPNA